MGYVFDFKDAGQYDAWLDHPVHRHCLDLEIKTMMELIKPSPGRRILDIGCGTGISLVPFLDQGLILSGIDPSPYMLDRAVARLGSRADFHRGSAEDLPFEDNAFDCALFFTSLEFTDRPAKAIEEACRVAKDQVVICVLNRYAPLNMARRLKGFFSNSIFRHARFFSIWELKHLLTVMLGKIPVMWRTTPQFPFFSNRTVRFVENLKPVQKSPFGTLICMKIQPVPKFRTKPLVLRIKQRKSYKPVTTGLATRMPGAFQGKNG